MRCPTRECLRRWTTVTACCKSYPLHGLVHLGMPYFSLPFQAANAERLSRPSCLFRALSFSASPHFPTAGARRNHGLVLSRFPHRKSYGGAGKSFTCGLSSTALVPPTITAPTAINAIKGLEHDDRVAADHAHAQAHFLVVCFALGRLVQDDV